MVIYLYGSDSYRRNKKLKELIQAYREKHGEIDMLAVDFEEEPDGWLKVKEFLNQPSMFVDTKLAVVKESGAAEEKEWIKTLKLQLDVPKTFVIISDNNEPKKDFRFLLQAPVKSQALVELKDNLLAAFLKEQAKERNITFSLEAWQFFCAYIASQEERGWLAVQELEKIRLARFIQPISLENLKKVIHWSAKEQIFFLTQRLLQAREQIQKLSILERLLLQKEAGAHIFNLLAYQASGRDVIKLADYDIAIKSGKLEYEEALTDFVLATSH